MFAILSYLSYLLLKPYLVVIIVAGVVAYFLWPLQRMINKHIKRPAIAALILLILLTALILTFGGLIANAVINESFELYQNVKDFKISVYTSEINNFLGKNIDVDIYIKKIINDSLSFILKGATSFILGIPQRIIGFVVFVFVLYYLLKEGDTVTAHIKRLLPLDQKEKESLLNRFRIVFKATVYGVLLAALIQGIVGTIGLLVFQVPSPILFGLLLTVASTIPYLGASIVWFPIALYLIAIGDLFNGFGLMIFGIVVVSFVDNVVRPFIISKKSEIHPTVILLGVLGGLLLFGFIGLIIGPLVLALFTTLIGFFEKEYHS